MGKYFGTDGFRGEAGRTLTAQHAWQVGRFLAWHCARQCPGRRVRAAIGKDTRLSGYMLEHALAAGLNAGGADVYALHVTTTPSVAYIVKQEGFDCGVMISASHNPYTDNGIKLFGPDGEKMGDDVLAAAEHYLDGDLAALGLAAQPPQAADEAIGRTVDHDAGRQRYVRQLLALARPLQGRRIGLDCANGSAWRMAPQLFRELGAQVYAIGCQPDGTNINRNVGSTHPAALQALVQRERLEVGFAFDGDADRCLAVDENGALVTGDHLLYIFAKALRAAGCLPGSAVAATVMSNLGLRRALKAAGIGFVQTAVGDRAVWEKMLADGLFLGGEQSGHIILRQWASTGDGLLTALQLMNVLQACGGPLSALAAPVVFYPQVTRNVRVADRAAAENCPAVRRQVQAAAQALGEEGRILVRASGTEPLVRIMVEGQSEAQCAAWAAAVALTMEQEGLTV